MADIRMLLRGRVILEWLVDLFGILDRLQLFLVALHLLFEVLDSLGYAFGDLEVVLDLLH